MIVFAWVNDEDTKRAYEGSDDAYRVFRKMLESGHPPGDWSQLLAEARAEGQRLQQFAASITPSGLACRVNSVVMGASVQEGGHALEATARFKRSGQKNPNRIRVGILDIGGG